MLDCFHLFLHFITSLIKPVLWLKFFYRRKAGGGSWWQGGWWGVCPEKAPQGPALLLSLSFTLSFLPSILPFSPFLPHSFPPLLQFISSFLSSILLPAFFPAPSTLSILPLLCYLLIIVMDSWLSTFQLSVTYYFPFVILLLLFLKVFLVEATLCWVLCSYDMPPQFWSAFLLSGTWFSLFFTYPFCLILESNVSQGSTRL